MYGIFSEIFGGPLFSGIFSRWKYLAQPGRAYAHILSILVSCLRVVCWNVNERTRRSSHLSICYAKREDLSFYVCDVT